MSPLSKDPEERATSLMLIQKPDYPLRNTISQVRAVSASVKLIPTASLCSGTADPERNDSGPDLFIYMDDERSKEGTSYSQ